PGHRRTGSRACGQFRRAGEILTDPSILTDDCYDDDMTETVNRLHSRKARTRAALVAAARELLASRDPAEVSIQEITDTADVGFGSFSNHFASKQDLFDAAVGEVLEEHGAMLDGISAGI